MASQAPAPTAKPSLEIKPPRSGFLPRTAHRQVQFLHPGYTDFRNILLTLPALDSGGICHSTAIVACGLLAAGRWDGFLSLIPDGQGIPDGQDDILTEASYYFRVPGG